MDISVIIPTYNEGKYIGNCLLTLDKQTLKNFEVIVVDDGSHDMTFEVISKLQITNYKLHILTQDHKGAGAARNFGVKYAQGKILVFVDADMAFEKHFLKNLIKPILSGKTKGTFSKSEYVANWENVWARCLNINEGWERKRRHPKNYPSKQKVFRAILKNEFDKVGGFTPGGYTDDYSLSEKLGYMATEASNAIFYHKNPSNLKEVFDQAIWIGKRNYKFGLMGIIISLIRASLPFSLLIGLIKSSINFEPHFFIYKIVYDFGIFIGIINYCIWKKPAR